MGRELFVVADGEKEKKLEEERVYEEEVEKLNSLLLLGKHARLPHSNVVIITTP